MNVSDLGMISQGLIGAGLDEIGPAGTAMIVLGVIVSFSLQLLFCWIIMISFLSPDSKYDLQYLREWRVLYGHSVSFYDKVSGASLVSKICQGKPFEREWWNNALLNEVNAYLMPIFPGSGGFSVGVVLSSMALTIWACHISAELQNVGSFGRSILRLPRGRTVVSSIREDCEGSAGKVRLTLDILMTDERVFESISRERLIALSFVVLARLAIAIMLGTSGGLWLALTRDVTNIMLNAVALLFVLEIDDLLYKVLAPKHAIKYLASVREFEDTLPFDQRAANMLPGMRPLVNQVVFNYNVADMDKYMWRKEVDGKLLAVKHLPSAAEMEAWLQMSDTQAPEETAFGSRSYGTYCKDQDDPEWWEAEWIWPTLEALTGATSCAEAKPFCDQKELPLVRMVCPETCGCTDAASGLYSDNGCRQLCQKDLGILFYTRNLNKESRFQRALNRSTCHDFTAAEVHRKEVWQRWWSGFYNHSQGTWDEGNAMMQFASDGASGNCSFLETESWIRDTVCEASPRSWGEGGLQEFSEQRVGGSVLLMLHGFLLQLTFQQMSYTSHHLAGSKSFVRLRLNAVTSSRTTFARMEPCSPQGSDTLHPRPKPGNEARDPPTRFIGLSRDVRLLPRCRWFGMVSYRLQRLGRKAEEAEEHARRQVQDYHWATAKKLQEMEDRCKSSKSAAWCGFEKIRRLQSMLDEERTAQILERQRQTEQVAQVRREAAVELEEAEKRHRLELAAEQERVREAHDLVELVQLGAQVVCTAWTLTR
eukprot:s2203_g1.t1